jgi:hypothetical protein
MSLCGESTFEFIVFYENLKGSFTSSDKKQQTTVQKKNNTQSRRTLSRPMVESLITLKF